ncbi:MAG: PH domain-containing protein [Fibrobacter sp.]|nr:PH domain-containing protein [Fibrobacter sp.]
MENYHRYKIATEKADWRAICEINGVSFDALGTQKELAVLPNYLESGEIVFALTSGLMEQTVTSNTFDFGANTWLVVLTSERFLFLDAAMLTSSVDTQSIRLKNVQAISASQGFILGKIMIDLGSRIVVVDNCSKESVKVMAELGNRWIKELENGFVPPKETPEESISKDDKADSHERVNPPIADSPKISRTSATFVAGLFGLVGLHDFNWGDKGRGYAKWGLFAFSFLLNKNDHYIISSLILAVLCFWVLSDLICICDGSFFKDKESAPVAKGLNDFFALIYFFVAIKLLVTAGFDFWDERKKDTGKLASTREIVNTYNQNEAVADKTFDGTRLSIGGPVRSVEKDFWGDYVVKFEGLGGINIFNLGSKVTEIELTFPKKQAGKLNEVRKGDGLIANCIGRGLSLGTYSADKCKVVQIYKSKK